MSLRQQLASANRPLARFRNILSPGARVLMYHRVNDLGYYDQLTVTPDIFEEQMQWLSVNRDVRSTGQTLKAIIDGKQTKNLVAITFDDGYLDNLELALPIVEKYNLPITIYITTDFADQIISHPRYEKGEKRLHLNWDEITQLNKHPLITIGSHTISHPMLSELSDEQSKNEIELSKQSIESHLNQTVEEFCYPSGNFTARELQSVASSGYQYAVTVKPGCNRKISNPYAIQRTEVNDKDRGDLFAMKMDGAFDIFHKLLDVRREMTFSKNRKKATHRV